MCLLDEKSKSYSHKPRQCRPSSFLLHLSALQRVLVEPKWPTEVPRHTSISRHHLRTRRVLHVSPRAERQQSVRRTEGWYMLCVWPTESECESERETAETREVQRTFVVELQKHDGNLGGLAFISLYPRLIGCIWSIEQHLVHIVYTRSLHQSFLIWHCFVCLLLNILYVCAF